MAGHSLSDNFAYYFKRLNPSPTFVAQASSQHTTITGLIESPSGLASELSPVCFLQGSYSQDTSIYTINDVDIVVLCALWHPGPGSGSGRSYDRDQIFATIAAPLLADWRYAGKVHYKPTSMCIKVDLGIKVEILPVVNKSGNYNSNQEPFRLFRPNTGSWEDGYARQHQTSLSWKNNLFNARGNFIPAIKVFKHLRTHWGKKAVSFHLECLLYAIPNPVFAGNPADYIPGLLNYIANISAYDWYYSGVLTPCGERTLFSDSEWAWDSWLAFHSFVTSLTPVANQANTTTYREIAIESWQALLGDSYFPREAHR
jgi:hypothetical protein